MINAKTDELVRFTAAVKNALSEQNGEEFAAKADPRTIEKVVLYMIHNGYEPAEVQTRPNGTCPAMFAYDVLQFLSDGGEIAILET